MSIRSQRIWLGACALVLSVAGAWSVASYQRSQRPERRYQLALESLAADDVQQVRREIAHLRQHADFVPQVGLLSGALQLKAGMYAEALASLAPAGQCDATKVKALTLAGECAFRMGRLFEAASAFRAAVEFDEDAIDARRWLAGTLYDLGDALHAVEQLKILSKQTPREGRAELFLAAIETEAADYSAAIEHYREAFRRDPDPPDQQVVRYEFADALVKNAGFAEALEVLEKCEITSDSLVLRAKCEEALGRASEAAASLEQALELTPNHAPSLLLSAKLALSQKEPRRAIELAKRAVEANPYEPIAHYTLSQAHMRCGEKDQAQDELRRSNELQEMSKEFYDLRERAQREVDNADLRCRMGELSEKLGSLRNARFWYRSALGINPKHAAARAGLAAISDDEAAPAGHGPSLN